MGIGGFLDKQPVIFSLAQVRFSELKLLEDERSISKIQEIMRKMGFPEIEGIQENINNPTGVVQTKTTTFFSSPDRKSSFVVNSSQIAYRTTEYPGYKNFEEIFKKGLRALVEAFELQYQPVTRVGMRFLDLIILQEGEKFEDILKPELLGVSDIGDERKVSSFTENVRVNADGVVFIKNRVIFSPETGGVEVPPELAVDPIGSNGVLNNLLKERFDGFANMPYSVLDQDHFWQSGFHNTDDKIEFNVDSIFEKLDKLHINLGDVFKHLLKEEDVLERFKG